jgi:hypothetical protein
MRTPSQLALLLFGTAVGLAACAPKDVSPSPDAAGDAASPGSISSGPAVCDPFALSPKPISLGTIVGAGRSSAGTIYVVDDGGGVVGNHVFVSNNGVLERQRIAGSGSSPTFYVFTVTDHVPPFILQIDRGPSGPTAMGVLEGPATAGKRTIVIGQDGETLTLLAAADVASMPVRNLPGTQVLEYNARTADGRAMIVVRPADDWTYQDFRVFFGTPPDLTERHVVNVSRGNDTYITFDLDGVDATALYKYILTPDASGPGEATLTVGSATFALTLLPTTTTPGGMTYTCL